MNYVLIEINCYCANRMRNLNKPKTKQKINMFQENLVFR